MPRGYERKDGKLKRVWCMDIGPDLTISYYPDARYSPLWAGLQRVLADVQRKQEVLEADLEYIKQWLNDMENQKEEKE